MSWTYAFLYVVEFVTAPSFMVGTGFGVFIASVAVLGIYGPEMDRLREVIRGQHRELEIVAEYRVNAWLNCGLRQWGAEQFAHPREWEGRSVDDRWLHVMKVADHGVWSVTVTDERDQTCRSALLTTAMLRSLRNWLITELGGFPK